MFQKTSIVYEKDKSNARMNPPLERERERETIAIRAFIFRHISRKWSIATAYSCLSNYTQLVVKCLQKVNILEY